MAKWAADELGELAALRAEVVRLRELLKRVPSALNRSFSAGVEEREGGSARRQAADLMPVEALRADIRAALEARHD